MGRRLALAPVLPWSYHLVMTSVVKRSVSLPAAVFNELEQQAAHEGRTVSSALAEAAEMWLISHRGMQAVRRWEREHGALTQQELDAADAELDQAVVGER